MVGVVMILTEELERQTSCWEAVLGV